MNAASSNTIRVLLASWASSGCLAEGLPPGSAPDVIAKPACAVEIPMRRLTPTQYKNAIAAIFDGRVEASARFPQQTGRSATGFSTEPDLNSVDRLAAEQIMLAAEDVAVQLPDALAPCGGAAACIEAFLERATKRAFRRPSSEAEQGVLRRVFDDAQADGADHEEAAAMVLAVVLQSPQFLYTLEAGTSQADVRQLSPYEVATRLSLLLWDGIPDDKLLAAADSGRLATADGVVVEARRMLADPKAERMSRRFFREWLHVETLTAASHDPERYPWYCEELASSIGVSFDRYVHTALLEGWTLEELLTKRSAPIDDVLAEHFGVPAPSEPWAWAELDRVTGVMTQPAVMASLAHYDEGSYVGRGHTIVSGLLCRSLGDPPANATSEFASIQGWLRPNASRRELSQAVRRNSSCATCHLTLDPPGLAFENFDATGRWRDADLHGNPIDASGTIAHLNLEFSDAHQMMTSLADRYDAKACFERQIFRYFAARLDGSTDVCVLDRMRSDSAEDGSLTGTLLSLIASDAFRYRVVR